ncbi:hypothetical protein PHYBOEH_002172 [Phytophthora boehmeriae]|uniref:Uncharacterized protein n=1 Tax=Phytophthora boehmeriae TaxID=109152 RepID=A0A8T1WXJ6_9STRA|nr:hypothetical protein PHYBOEH_002172 [Phytophthora boehmeriae]
MAEFVCPRGSLMAFAFAGENYLLCMPQQHHDGFQIFGADLDIGVHSAPKIEAPSIPVDVEEYCGKVPFNNAIAPSTMNLLHRSFSEWGHRSLRIQESESWISSVVSSVVSGVTGDSDDLSSSTSCSTTPRLCVFVAGLGQKTDSGLSTTDTKPYFGDKIHDYAPCCSSIQYIELATSLYAWYDTALTQRLVDLLVQVSPTSDATTGTIRDT